MAVAETSRIRINRFRHEYSTDESNGVEQRSQKNPVVRSKSVASPCE